MPQITNYSTLQSAIADWLNRDDLTASIPELIQSGEARLRRDDRAKLLIELDPFTVSTAATTLPADYDSHEALAHVGPTYHGEIEVVDPGKLAEVNGRLYGGATGYPRYAAIVEDATGAARVRWAPEPDQSYDLRLVYWSKLTPLSATNTVNRFLLAHPDIYRYAALCESAPYLKEDPRLAVWEQALNNRLDDLHRSTQRRLFSGSLVRRPSNYIP